MQKNFGNLGLPNINEKRESKTSQNLIRHKNNSNSVKDMIDSFSKNLITENTNFKKTDDIFFAENELRNINRKNQKKSMNKVKIWEKPATANQEKDINIRKKIQELKQTCRETSGFNSNDLCNLKYFNRGNIETIKETSKIITDKNNQKLNGPIKQDKIFTFVTDNREICMKNFLLGLLKDERSFINEKELMVNKALKDYELRLDRDYKYYVEFIDKEKKIQKENEIRLIQAYDSNRELAARKKKSNLENKQICDEIDRTIKGILSLKSYAGFVHIVLGDTNIKFEFDRSILDNRNSENFEVQIKDKDLEKNMEFILNEFKELDLDKNNPIKNLLNDHSAMTMKFQEFEENILKLMENKQTIEKESERIKIENDIELKKLSETESLMKIELMKLKSAKEKDGKILKDLKKNSCENGANSDISKMIHELYLASIHGEESDPQSLKKLKNKKEVDCIKEIMETLRYIEFEIIDYIDNLVQVSKLDEARFKSIVNSRKEDNKKKKQQAQKIKSEGDAHLKKEKAEERMHRVVIKGRKVIEHRLIGKGSKKAFVDLNSNKNNDDFNMLIYDNNEDF